MVSSVITSGLIVIFLIVIFLIILIYMASKAVFASGEKTKQNAITSPESDMPSSTENSLTIDPMRYSKDRLTEQQESPSGSFIQEEIDDDVLAAISAAVAVILSSEKEKTHTIKSIRYQRNTRPVWAQAGIMENTQPFHA